MATLKETAGKVARTTSGVKGATISTSAPSATIQESKTIDKGAKLAKDLGINLQKIAGEVQSANISAGKRAGSELLADYTEAMAQSNQKFAEIPNPTAQQYADKTDMEQQLYQEMVTKGSFGNNDLANQGFKDVFAKPATNLLFANKQRNSQIGTKLFQKEETEAVELRANKALATFSGNTVVSSMTKDMADTLEDQIVGAGLDKDVATNKIVTSQLTSLERLATEDLNKLAVMYTKDEQGTFNGLFGAVATMDKKGEIHKVKKDMSDVEFKRILGGWKVLGSTVGKQTDIDTQITEATANLKSKYVTMSSEQVQTAVNGIVTQGNQKNALGFKLSKSEFKAVREASLVGATYEKLSAIYTGIAKDGGAGLRTARANGVDIATTIPSQDGLSSITVNYKLKPAEIDNFLKTKFTDEVNQMIASGSPASANKLANTVKSLKLSGLGDLPVVTKIVRDANHGASGAKSITELNNTIVTAVAYGNDAKGGDTYADGPTQGDYEIIQNLQARYAKERESGVKISEADELLRLKSAYNIVLNNRKKDFTQPDVMKQHIANQDKGEEYENLVEGYAVGTVQPVQGVMDILGKLTRKNSNEVTTPEEFETMARSRTAVIDSDGVWGTSMTIIRPYSLSTAEGGQRTDVAVTGDQMQKNMTTLLKRSVDKLGINIEVDDDSIGDDENFKVSQSIGDDGTILTAVSVYSAGKLLHYEVMYPDEVASGKKNYNRLGLK